MEGNNISQEGKGAEKNEFKGDYEELRLGRVKLMCLLVSKWIHGVVNYIETQKSLGAVGGPQLEVVSRQYLKMGSKMAALETLELAEMTIGRESREERNPGLGFDLFQH